LTIQDACLLDNLDEVRWSSNPKKIFTELIFTIYNQDISDYIGSTPYFYNKIFLIIWDQYYAELDVFNKY